MKTSEIMLTNKRSVGEKVRTCLLDFDCLLIFLTDILLSKLFFQLSRYVRLSSQPFLEIIFRCTYLPTDRAAFANAYVAGLREALHMSGHDYNTVLSVTTAGMAIGQIPHGLIIQKVPPRIWLPSMVVVWAALTMVSATVKTVTQLCVVRFSLGLAEASTYAGTIYIIGSWYTPSEIAKRTAIFTASGQVGTMFAGVMMAAIYKGMGGLGGLGGWQWVFLIDGIITLPVAFFGFYYFPDIPENTQALYLSDSEKKLAVSRLPPIKEGGHSISPISLMKRLAMSPTFWILLFWSPVCATLEAWAVQNNFLIWLKYQSSHFSQTQINTYPLGVQAVGIVSNMFAAWHMDVTGTRIPMATLAIVLQLVCAILLIIPNIPFAGTFFAFYLSGTAYMVNPLIFGWASIILQRSGDDAVRSVTVYCMNVGSLTLYTFWGIVFYSADEAPYWRKGCIVMIVCCFVMLGYMWAVWKLDKHTFKKFAQPVSQDAEAETPVSEVVSRVPISDGKDIQKRIAPEKVPSI
ncbi:major facilitator superfamily transporter [Colletotrichum paranaense]|uniref:Major facilitator superfamily transporter n=1 Tax=Colletotrichum paranaense TaxID=1914294 RepID=A0ABQ9S9M2_9PEZI|nr:major facilitator superfamily transporter [Colletotrichum paranaense]KAK1530001.1 major facilitator superfamily transporter [Colletotrichum paranaense]